MSWGLRLALGAFSAVGTAAAHALTYIAAVPDPHARAAILESSGHQYWDAAIAVLASILFPAVIGFVFLRLPETRQGGATRHGLLRYAGIRLGAVQCMAFVVVEIAERTLLAEGGSPPIQAKVLAIGLAVQLAVALTIAALLASLDRIIEHVSGRLPGSQVTPRVPFVSIGKDDPFVGSRPLRASISLRGPPCVIQLVKKSLTIQGGLMKARFTFVAALAAMAVLSLAAPALAHVTFSNDQAPAEGRFTSFLRVGHGCETDGPNTVELAVQIPEGVIGATPEDEPGWTSEVKMTKLDQPLDTGEGDPITEVPSEVTFRGPAEGLDEHKFREFGLSLNIAAPDEEVLYFPTVQRCQQGANRWVNVPASLEEWGDTEDPPPYLELAPAEEAETEAAPLTEEDVRAIVASEASAESDSGTDPMVWVALAAGLIGLVAGVSALTKAGRRA